MIDTYVAVSFPQFFPFFFPSYEFVTVGWMDALTKSGKLNRDNIRPGSFFIK